MNRILRLCGRPVTRPLVWACDATVAVSLVMLFSSTLPVMLYYIVQFISIGIFKFKVLPPGA